MKILDAIGFVIDFVVVFIQSPYIFIAGYIMGGTYCPDIGSKAVYVWYPTEGVIKAHMESNEDIVYELVTYKELFH